MSPAITFISGIVLLLLFGWYFTTDKEKLKRILGSALTVLAAAMALWSFVPPFDEFEKDANGQFVLDANGNKKVTVAGKIGLGIDLKGGTSFLLRLKPDETNPKPITDDSLERAIEAIRNRVDSMGTSEPVIAPAPPDRVLVQLPGVDPARIEAYREALKKVAKLEFRMVHVQSQSLIMQKAVNPATFIDPAYEIVTYKHRQNGKDVEDQMVVSKKVEITGDKVKEGFARMGQMGGWEIHLVFDDVGGKQFAEVTQRMAANKNQREQFAILMDKVVISAAGLTEDAMARGGIDGGSAIIQGDFEEKEARGIASALLNPLENPVSIEEERSTSSTLGQDAINSGVLAGLVGAAITVLVTLLYYRFAGLVANLALIVFALLLFGAMGMFNAVLTLPGIAGILLTLGMAIDANVLIYERLREEQAAGKNLKAALDSAYDKAFSAIFDSNVTTLITAGLLFWKATGPVKGFAVSLVIGVIASMFSALIVTRNLFAWGLHKGIIKKITMVDLIPVTKFDFMGKRKMATIGSLVVIFASIGIFAMRGEKNFGVDFKGGTKLTYDIQGKAPSMDAVRASLNEIGESEAVAQEESSANQKFLVIRTADQGVNLTDFFAQKFAEAKLKSRSDDRVLFTPQDEKADFKTFHDTLKASGESESAIKELTVDGVKYFAVQPAKANASEIERKLGKAYQRFMDGRVLFKPEGTMPALDAVTKALAAVKEPDAVVTEEPSAEGALLSVKLGKNRITKHLETKFPEAKMSEANVERVGAVVGQQLANNSLMALGLGMVGILIYVTVRFEFSFAIGALVALLHDVIITVGVFSLLGRELSLVIVGAVLTVAGYSVNDTIVVYDRIREGIKAGRAGSITAIMNASINETLSRTILTGGVTLLTTFALFIFGGPVLNDFALTILVGILVGTYSSIFIAAPVVLWWSGRGGRDLKSEVKRSDETPAVAT